MQTSPPDLTLVLITGTVMMVILLVFIFLVVVLQQRRTIRYQATLRELQEVRQRELLKAVFEAQEGERRRLAADLHDSVGQVVSVIKFNLHRLQKLGESTAPPDGQAPALLTATSELAEECIGEIRNIIHNVLPPLLTDFGLVEALRHLAAKVERATAIRVIFRAPAHHRRYPQETELALYRVGQELFNNAIKHAGASVIQLTIEAPAAALEITFEDDGRGFPSGQPTGGLGLKNLESRVGFLRGEIRVAPGPAGGTRAWLRVPVGEAADS